MKGKRLASFALLILLILSAGCGEKSGNAPTPSPSAAPTPAPTATSAASPAELPEGPSPTPAREVKRVLREEDREDLLSVSWDEEDGPRHTVKAGDEGYGEVLDLLLSLEGEPITRGKTTREPYRFYLRRKTGSSWLSDWLFIYEVDGSICAVPNGQGCYVLEEPELAEALCSLCKKWGSTQGELTPADHSRFLEADQLTLAAEYPVCPAGATEAWFIMENQTEETLCWNQVIHLEIWKDGEWNAIPFRDGSGWFSVLYSITAGGRKGFSVFFGAYDWDMCPGRYRLCMEYAYETEYSMKRFDRLTSVEFEVAEDAPRRSFPPLEEQTTDPEKALEEGCALLMGGVLPDETPLREFVDKVVLGIPAELRIVSPEEGLVRHLSCYRYEKAYDQYGFTLETLQNGERSSIHYRACIYLPEEGMLALSSWVDPAEAEALGFSVDWDKDVLPLLPLDGEAGEALLRAAEARRANNYALQSILCPPEEDCLLSLGLRDGEWSLSLESRKPGWGRVFENGTMEGEHPLRLMADWEAGTVLILWALPEGGTEVRQMRVDPEQRLLLPAE